MGRLPLLGFIATLALGSACAAPGPVAHSVNARVTNGGLATADGLALASEDDAAVPISAADPVWGSRQALVTVVVFGDFQCPFTANIVKTVQALQLKYGPSDLRVVWKEKPLSFHDMARTSAEAAEVVRIAGKNDAFWKFWEQALTHQADLAPASLETWAESSGVDRATFRRLMAAHAAGGKVDGDAALATRLEAFGTPTFFVNGVRVVGAQPLDRFTTVVDAALTKARATAASGVPLDRLYAAVTKDSLKAPPPEGDDDEKEDDVTVWNVPIDGAPSRGTSTALVTIVEFSDYQCPFCKRVEPTLAQVRTKYRDKVRIVWRDEPLPFHPRARPAAALAREARAEKGEAGFWAAHDALFESQPSLEDADLDRIAHAIGLSAIKAKSSALQDRYQAQIDKDVDLADDVEASGTPHFFINGRRLVGAQPLERFAALIDQEVTHAGELLAKGTAPAALYDTMIKGGRTPPLPESRAVATRADAPWKGSAKARVVIEEFADFECPFCAREEPVLQQIAKEYGASVKFVWRNMPLPFHKDATLAAEAALEAQHQKGNAAFWAMHDKLFAHQRDPGDGSGLQRAALEAYATELGLDLPAFRSALDRHTHKDDIDTDIRAADAAHVDGAPTFFVGGYVVSGAQPISKFRRLIERVLGPSPPAAVKTQGSARP